MFMTPLAALCPAGPGCKLLQRLWQGPASLHRLSLACPPQHCVINRTAAQLCCILHRCLYGPASLTGWPRLLITAAESFLQRRLLQRSGCRMPRTW